MISKHVPKCIFAERDKLVVLVGKETLERIIICYISYVNVYMFLYMYVL